MLSVETISIAEAHELKSEMSVGFTGYYESTSAPDLSPDKLDPVNLGKSFDINKNDKYVTLPLTNEWLDSCQYIWITNRITSVFIMF